MLATGGFAHFLKLLEGAMSYAERTRRKLLVSTPHSKPLGFLSFSKIFDTSSSRFVPEDISTIAGNRIHTGFEGAAYFASSESERVPLPQLRGGFNGYFDNSPILTRGVSLLRAVRFSRVTRDLRLSQQLASQVARALDNIDLSTPFVGAHIRFTDRQEPLANMRARLEQVLTQSAYERVILATDSRKAESFVRKTFKDQEVICLPKPEARGKRNLHYGVSEAEAETQLVFAIADLFLMTTSSVFVPSMDSGTAWTKLILELRKQPNKLFGPIAEAYSSGGAS